MADVTTSRTATGVPARYQEKGVFVDVATYEAAALQIADRIFAINVAPGVTVLRFYAIHDALGASTTLNLGDGDSATYWAAAESTSSVGNIDPNTSFPKTYASGGVLQSVLAGGAATGTITFVALMTAEAVDLT